jgi:alpha-methylacyl-CoA racemase
VGPLAGLKVVELAAVGPLPFCTMLLGDMGADILRIERVGKAVTDRDLSAKHDLRSRNKRSAIIDLKHPEGVEAFLKLVDRADVVLEGYRPGVAERLGIGPDVCLTRRPSLVYGRVTGWGREGPMAQKAGHDVNFIALTGVLDLIGTADGPPVLPLSIIGDYAGGGTYLAFGVVCAVLEAIRSGKGQVVDSAVIDGVTSLMTMYHAFRQKGQITPGRGMNMFDGGAPYNTTYMTRDGRYVAVAAFEPQFYASLLERLDLIAADLPSREEKANWPALRARLAERFLSRTRDEWEQHFSGTDACFTPVLSIDEAGNHPHNAMRGLLTAIDGVEHPTPAPRLSRTPGAIRSLAPQLGQHTVSALREWGFTDQEVHEGLLSGVFVQA